MSKRRKKVRGNPAREATEPESTGAPGTPGGLRAFRQARREGRDISTTPKRRDDVQDGYLSAASQRAGEGTDSNPHLLLYALLGLTALLFAYLHLYALPQMNYFAGGFSMPDSRLLGYSVDDIERLRNVMDSDGTGQLSFLHRTAGILFPLFFLLSSWAVVGLVMRRGLLRWLVLAGAVIFAAVDITENFLIDRILTMESLDAGLVAAASWFTVVSWALLIILGAAVVGSVVMSLLRKGVERP
ncbi:hypothetical protein LTH96_09610 [Nesterenkonia sp. LB17]|uniref:hypothetical protein n=1 Tax=unclassified Nesterenkonia TaxID=2629769 RepID=UPI001F4CA460|nr:MULTISPECIES: hypothetical protein [unclassified Nesterenkonia]MCH8560656.1 hypothetical protein [Nesterenkonia sp. DZ6]MCH8565972.1 hypothetical protein [Nesterenkonia sp. LB17]MCH8570764.1 hypothetical protein [Nesterenkonia sp. AY15]